MSRGGVRATRAVACLIAVAGTVAALACGNLPDLGTACGNSIVDESEDCDRFTEAPGTVCRQPGTPGQCRYDCTQVTNDAGALTGPNCPAGYRCGSDSICRQPTGMYEPFSGAGIASLADSVTIADFNGDKINDILARSRIDLTVYFGDTDGKFSTSFTIAAADVSPTAGVITNHDDLRADIAYSVSNLGGAVSVWQGNSNRTLTAIPYPVVTIPKNPPGQPPPDEPRVLPLEVLSGEPGREILVLLSIANQNIVILKDLTHSFDRAPQDTVLFTLTDKPENMASLVRGTFREDAATSPCDELALAFKAENKVHVMTPCRGAVANGTPGQIVLPDVQLEMGTVGDGGFLVSDLNNDGHLDLVINGVLDRMNPKPLSDPTEVAFGLGDGTFNSTLPLPAPGAQDNLARRNGNFPIYPLAVARLTNDDLPDIVTPRAILLVTRGSSDAGIGDASPLDGGGNFLEIIAPRDTVWNEAHILDLNGDGFLDVIAGSTQASIDVYTGGAEGLFSHSSYAAEGATHGFVFGDFDGDGTVDTAFGADGPLANSLSIMFGRPRGTPFPPVRVTEFDTIEQIESGVFHTFGRLPADGMADLSVVWRSHGTQYISILEGSTDRQIQAPFVLAKKKAGVTGSALGLTFGAFTHEPNHETIIDTNHADIGAVGRIPGLGTEVSVRFWRSQMVDVARLGQADNSMTMGPDIETYESDPAKLAQNVGRPSHAWDRVALASLRLDKNVSSLEQMVVLAPPSHPGALSSAGKGTLYVERVDGDTFTDLVPPIQLGPDRNGKRGVWQLATVDLDGDDAKEVVVFADGPEAILQVFWNRQNGSFDNNATRVQLPPCAIPTLECHRPLGFAAINADGDARKELFILTSTGIFSAKSLEPNTFTVSAGPVPGFGLEALKGADAGPNLTPTFIAAGDVNGDGVDDLVLVFPGSIKVYRGLCKGLGCEARVSQ